MPTLAITIQFVVGSLVAKSRPTLCDPMDCSPPGSSVHGILQARILKWVASSPEDLPYPGIEPGSPALQADSSLPEPLLVNGHLDNSPVLCLQSMPISTTCET